MRTHAATVALAAVALGLLPAVATPAQSAASLPRTTLTADARDLGTLGGPRSVATDIDGTLVVGSSLMADGLTWHAFAYDLRGSTMRDLGTLGGRSSDAKALDGTIVTGTADTADGKRHAFAYDLATSTMRDVGTLIPGGTSEASDIDDGVVVGQSGPRVGQGHAFAYDVASGTLRDLGDLGLGQSQAAAVDAGTVVGDALSTTTWERHPFAYDLATSTMHALSPNDLISAVDVSDGVVVGHSTRPAAFAFDLTTSTVRNLPGRGYTAPTVSAVDGRTAAGESSGHAVTWDLSDPQPVARDLGSLGAGVTVTAVRDGVVVGQAARAGDGRPRAIAIDLRSSRPRLTDLGTLGGFSASALAVVGRTVVGWSSNTRHDQHATAWTLRTTPAPSMRLARLRTAVREDVGKARLGVLRDGNPARAVSVKYVVRRPWPGGTVLSAGTLRFAAGQVRRIIVVPVRDDARTESGERYLVALRSPSGARMGTPSAGELVVRPSDQRPDAAIAASVGRPFVGIGVHNTTGAHQTRTVTVPRGVAHDFPVTVRNTGDARVDVVLHGSRAAAGTTVRYLNGEVDITGDMRSAGGRRVRLTAYASTTLTVRIIPAATAAVGSLKPASVNATWRGDRTSTDVVRAVAKVAR